MRQLQQQLESQGLVLTARADPAPSGPASMMPGDPDGNPVLAGRNGPVADQPSRLARS